MKDKLTWAFVMWPVIACFWPLFVLLGFIHLEWEDEA